jgi:hypothetical protein
MRFLSVLLALAVVAGLSHADVIPAGSHPVSYHAYIDNLDEYASYQFFVYPTSMGGGIAYMDSDLVPGQALCGPKKPASAEPLAHRAA